MRSRMLVVGLVLIVALALITESVLLVGYVTAAASLLIGVMMLVRKALRSASTATAIEAAVPRWGDPEGREAA